MAQSTTNLGKIHVFPSETLYNQFKDIIADNDLALLKDDGAYIVAALLEQNGYVKFSNGLILQWGYKDSSTSIVTFNLSFPTTCFIALVETLNDGTVNSHLRLSGATNVGFSTWDSATNRPYSVQNYWLALGI